MAYIKKMVMQGFKSFAKKTEIPFDKEINLFVGPNGSGKTNVADALCFVLGRLSIKSMRAVKAKNLIFMGSKYIKPAKEAYVELVIDNSDKVFSIDKDQVNIKRIVRTNGQSIYKINGETKTRNEVIEMLAQAGIDPYGFNLIMQGQIQSVVKMHSEDRRKIIEEVAGISIYESRKEKSLKELEKTDERLKEIATILRERTAYLRNLGKEKEQAEKYKDAQLIVNRAKASITSKKLKDKEKEIFNIVKSIEDKDKVRDKIKVKIESIQKEIDDTSIKINEINKYIQKSTGIEQENLHNEIANLKAELEGLKVRKESHENKHLEIEKRIAEISKSVPELENEIEELRKQSPLMAKKSAALQKKKEELNEIEKERKRLLTLITELDSLKERIKDKEKQLERVNIFSDSLLKSMEEISKNLDYADEKECLNAIQSFKNIFSGKRKESDLLIKKEMENEKILSVSDSELKNWNEIKNKVKKIDICPLCQSKITEGHIKHVHDDAEDKIKTATENKNNSLNDLKKIRAEKEKLNSEIEKIKIKISKLEIELINHKNILEKKEQIKKAVDDENILKGEIKGFSDKMLKLEDKANDFSNIEAQYEKKMLEIEEISSRTEEDIDTTLLYKERELENIRNVIKRSKKDFDEIELQIGEIGERIEDKLDKLNKLEEQEEELQERFKKLFASRDEMQKKIQEKNLNLSETQQESRQMDDQINYLKIGKAKLDAEHEALSMELSEFGGIELIQGSINILEEKLKRAQGILQSVGSINMRALEVYDQVKKEYDVVQEKVDTLQKEKEDVLKIIEEIDRKKTRTFMKTFKAINSLFSENFSKLSSKGAAYLEIENEEDIFSGGVGIAVKLARGKYFDVTSLSGGEQTLVALSLLFAIQEHRPYHFYVFDEIDAALDKRNSSRLAGLLNQYMKSGQYIVITHNDALITNSNILYGVSMHEGVSKILSLKLDNLPIKKQDIQTEAVNLENIEETIKEKQLSNIEGGNNSGT